MKGSDVGKFLLFGGVAGVAGYFGWKAWKSYEARRATDEVAENDRMIEEFDYRMNQSKGNGHHKPKPRRRSKASTT